jgi:vacuolar-type H+-ATPase subunit D/Vma8
LERDAHEFARKFVQSREWLIFHGEEPEQRLIDELSKALATELPAEFIEMVRSVKQQRDELAAALRRVQQWFKYPKMDDRPTEVIKAALKRVEEATVWKRLRVTYDSSATSWQRACTTTAPDARDVTAAIARTLWMSRAATLTSCGRRWRRC